MFDNDGEPIGHQSLLQTNIIDGLVVVCTFAYDIAVTVQNPVTLYTKGNDSLGMPHLHRFQSVIVVRIEKKADATDPLRNIPAKRKTRRLIPESCAPGVSRYSRTYKPVDDIRR